MNEGVLGYVEQLEMQIFSAICSRMHGNVVFNEKKSKSSQTHE